MVAGAFILVAGLIDALRDVVGLAMQVIFEAELVPMEAILLITDSLDGRAHSRFDFGLRAGRPFSVHINTLAADFAREHDQLGGCQRFTGDARLRVFRQEQIDDGIRNLVGDFVRMAFGNRFAGKQKRRTRHWEQSINCKRRYRL